MAVVPVMIASALEIIWEESIILEKRIVLRPNFVERESGKHQFGSCGQARPFVIPSTIV